MVERPQVVRIDRDIFDEMFDLIDQIDPTDMIFFALAQHSDRTEIYTSDKAAGPWKLNATVPATPSESGVLVNPAGNT